MSDFTPERRDAYVHAMRERRNLTAGLPYSDCWETAARLLELDGAGVIDLDSEPGLRAYVTARMDLLEVPTSEYAELVRRKGAEWAALIGDQDSSAVGSPRSPSHARRH